MPINIAFSLSLCKTFFLPFSLTRPPFQNLQTLITFSFLTQILSNKVQTSSFFNSLQTPLIKIYQKCIKWQTHLRSARVQLQPPPLQAKCHHDTSGDSLAPPNPSISSPRSLTLFSSDEQRQRYYSSFSNRVILDPKYLDLELFEGETFDCYQVFQNFELINFMSLKMPYYPELVRIFYNNLKIRDGVIFS